MKTSVSISEHFRRLFDFSGREDRASFWPYAAVAFGIVMAVGVASFLPMMMEGMQKMQDFAAQHPDQVTVRQGPSSYSISVSGEHPPFFSAGGLMLYLGLTFGTAFLLYAAAVARRLRDTGVTPWLGMLPVPFIAFSSVQMPQLFASTGSQDGPQIAIFVGVFVSNLLYMLALGALVVLLARKAKESGEAA